MSAQATISEQARLRLHLAMTPGLGPTLSARLIELCGSLGAACQANYSTLQRVQGIGQAKARSIAQGLQVAPELAEAQVELAQAQAARIIALGEPEYPELLTNIPAPPQILFVRGRFALSEPNSFGVAMVGSRRCSAYGIEQAERFAGVLAQAGLVIVSGGARGIDTAAHRGAARAAGQTVVVLGCGLSHCYPPENRELFDRIVDQERGAIVSELPMQTAPNADNFPARNRIISGLSLGVLVIEAGRRSGALITARQALEDHQREVMAVPGRVDNPACDGTNDLLKQGGAAMVTSPADVLELLETPARHQHQGTHADRYPGQPVDSGSDSLQPLDPAQDGVLKYLDAARTVEELMALSGLAAHELRSILTMLEIQGRVSRRGPRFERRR